MKVETHTHVCGACLSKFDNWVDIKNHWMENHAVYYGARIQPYLVLYHPNGFTEDLQENIDRWAKTNHLPYHEIIVVDEQ